MSIECTDCTDSENIPSGIIENPEILSFLKEILMQAAELSGTPHAYIYLVDSASSRMNIRCSSGIFSSISHHPLAKGEGIAGNVWKSGTLLCVDDYAGWEGRIEGKERDAIHAFAGFPLYAKKSLIGVIGLAHTEKGENFSERDISILKRFSGIASLGIEHAIVKEELKTELVLRKRSEEELKLYKHIVDQAPVSILITDREGVIEYANPNLLALTGYTLPEVTRSTSAIFKSGRTTDEEYRQLWETISRGLDWKGEFQNIKKDGELYTERALISPLRDSDGEITHYIGIKEDITEQKALENQLRHSQKMEAVGRMAAGMAHDFNNILTAVIGYANIIQMQLGTDNPLSGHLDRIIASAERGAELTRGLLAFSRKQISNPVLLDMNQILKKSLTLIKKVVMEDKKIEVSLADSPLSICADSMEMEQIILNLATNANDALMENGVISITTGKALIDHSFILSNGFGVEGEYATLTVADNGTGIDEGIRDKIFEPFFTTKETGKGTGLGLAIIYGIVKKNRGFIRLSSEKGKGSAFTVYIPVSSTEAGVIQPKDSEPVINTDKKSQTVLLAEDEEVTRDVTCDLLENFGYKVVAAPDGAKALNLFKENAENLSAVILDWVMPEMSGEELLKAIRKIDGSIPVIISSGYGEDTLDKDELKSMKCHILAKPYTPRDMLQVLKESLRA